MARAFASVQGDLRQIQLFHTDRGREFKNKLIDEMLTEFQISRSLSVLVSLQLKYKKIAQSERISFIPFCALSDAKGIVRELCLWLLRFNHLNMDFCTKYEYALMLLKLSVIP